MSNAGLRLKAFRDAAVDAAGGTSNRVIKKAILNILKGAAAPNRVLDFGAGAGELLEEFVGNFPKAELTGVDYLPRPLTLPNNIRWISQDLNDQFSEDAEFDLIVCSEVIEHLENPRLVMRQIYKMLSSDGTLILTTPNQESIRSYAALLFGGHFAAFLGASYPAHITALLRLDFTRICWECGFCAPTFHYTNMGGVPKKPAITWQRVSLGFLSGRLFSDNVIVVAKKPL